MDFNHSSIIKWLGPNLEKGKKNYREKEKDMKDKFKKDYPYAKISEFEFWITLNKNGTLGHTDIRYIGDGKGLYDITGRSTSYSWSIYSNVFKYRYSDALTWGPSSGVFQPSNKDPLKFVNGDKSLGYSPRKFRVYVTKTSLHLIFQY